MMRDEVQATHPGIQFSLVSPGIVWTEFGKNAVHGGPDSRAFQNGQEVSEVAAVIAEVVRSRKPDVYTRVGSADAGGGVLRGRRTGPDGGLGKAGRSADLASARLCRVGFRACPSADCLLPVAGCRRLYLRFDVLAGASNNTTSLPSIFIAGGAVERSVTAFTRVAPSPVDGSSR